MDRWIADRLAARVSAPARDTFPPIMRALALASALLLPACAGRYPDAHDRVRELTGAAEPPAWPRDCLVANHVHTLVSDRYSHDPTAANEPRAYDPAGLRAAIALFARDGVGAIVVTDHNSPHAGFDPAVATAPLTVIPGMEWTTRRGHALQIGLRLDRPADAILPPRWRDRVVAEDFRRMVEATHSHGGLVIIAHPRVPFRTWPDDTFGADGVEIWGLDSVVIRNRQAVRWWHDRLIRGERLIAVAGTDLHPGAWLRDHRRPLNRVTAATCGADDVLAGLRSGHVLLVDDGAAPRVVLAVDGEARPGDTLPLEGRGEIDLQLRVLAGKGARVRLLGPAGELFARTVAGPDETVRLRLRVRPGEFVRAELHRRRKPLALTNPVYFR
ncbi:CehA/McbA family metallohydrolase [Nannocystis bainbridge]|uniref:CehA/McbA family metallohydrolase n=1 Tax=Nannocystis bainbridge TaxID=2995303 RepID=A0ABT5DS41_9BACT|nr:CehA/McbA family metallohydrolase [Nannocystis bainbridge]MDC0716472.1 CehA/McbA family metallohydrolase [Nannocystis bainbridge]